MPHTESSDRKKGTKSDKSSDSRRDESSQREDTEPKKPFKTSAKSVETRDEEMSSDLESQAVVASKKKSQEKTGVLGKRKREEKDTDKKLKSKPEETSENDGDGKSQPAKKRRKKERDFSSYIYQIAKEEGIHLKRDDEDKSGNNFADQYIRHLNAFAKDYAERIGEEAKNIAILSRGSFVGDHLRVEITQTDMESAIRIVCPPEISEKAIQMGRAAIERFKQCIDYKKEHPELKKEKPAHLMNPTAARGRAAGKQRA